MNQSRNKTVNPLQVLTVGMYVSGFSTFVGLILLMIDLLSGNYVSTTAEISTIGYVGAFLTIAGVIGVIPILLIALLTEND